jgi:hypothetical protein
MLEIRDEPRKAEEQAEKGVDVYSSTGEFFEALTDPDDGEPIEVSEGDTEPPQDRHTR